VLEPRINADLLRKMLKFMNGLTSKLRVVLANPVKIFMQEYDSFGIVGLFFKDRGEI
jgi:hypothetical protein